MTPNSPLAPPSSSVKNALTWLSQALEDAPQKKRGTLVKEAELRFDLTPAECAFLDKNFTADIQDTE